MGLMYHIKELEADELNLIATALSKLPFEAVAPLIAKLKAQVQSIEAEVAAEKAAKEAPKATAAPSAPAPTQPAPAAIT